MHRDDDAQDGGNDADAGKRVANFVERGHRGCVLMMMDIDLCIHKHVEVVRRYAAHEDQTQRVTQESRRVVKVEQFFVFLEKVAPIGILDVAFDRNQPVTARDLKQLIQQF